MEKVLKGIVVINGELIDETCSIEPDCVNFPVTLKSYESTQIESGDESIIVTLPKLFIITLASDGSTAGSKAFDIYLTGINTEIKNVRVRFDAVSAQYNPLTGNLLNGSGSGYAENVELRLYGSDSEQQSIPVGRDKIMSILGDKAELRYYVGYYATGRTTVGVVRSSVNYTITLTLPDEPEPTPTFVP